MATERSLATLLRSLQLAAGPHDAHALLPSCIHFLSILTNPLNVTLLASQLLTSPALWNQDTDLRSCQRILSVFNTAAISKIQNETTNEPRVPYTRQRGLDREAWVKAVIKGADEKSPRWRHLLLLGGILLGFESQNRQGLPSHLRGKLESALVQATQIVLQEKDDLNGIAGHAVTMVLNYTFELISDWERGQIDYDVLLPCMLNATFFSNEGLCHGYFLGAVDPDVRQNEDKTFGWSSQSTSFNLIKSVLSRPLVASLGPLSRLIGHAMEHVRDPSLVSDGVNSISDFARTLLVQWRQSKLSEVDVSEEGHFLDAESLKATLPELWRLLRSCMFSTVIILRAVLGRVLNDRALAAGSVAPFIAMQALHALRNLYFISARVGPNSSTQYVFVELVSIDILTQYPDLAESFLRTIRPDELGHIPQHPLKRNLDLFFLNMAEHLALVLPPSVNEELVVSAAQPYLAVGGDNNLMEMFEAAHSVILAVFSAPQNAEIAVKYLPFYVDNLFAVFPQNLSVRQFRLAFKSLVKISTPPNPLARSHPLLASTLLELVHERAQNASSSLLPPTTIQQQQSSSSPDDDTNASPPVSEKSALILALIDSLPCLLVDDLAEWLPLTAQLINTIQDHSMRKVCADRFWDVLSNGEMDVDRANFCVTWWSTRGGRELLLFGDQSQGDDLEEPLMSGALNSGRESKL